MGETGNMKGSWDRQARCRNCGAEFVSNPMWAYRWNRDIFCSWKCLREEEKRRDAARKYRRSREDAAYDDTA